MSPDPKTGSSVYPPTQNHNNFTMTPDTNVRVYINPCNPYSPHKHHKMIYDPELGPLAIESNRRKAKVQRVLDKITNCIGFYAVLSIAITALMVSFFGAVSWADPQMAQEWLENGPWKVVIWVSFTINICLWLVMVVLDMLLDE